MARRQKQDRQGGIASRGMVRRWGRFSFRGRHRVVPDRAKVPERCHSSGLAMDVSSDVPAWVPRAEHAADSGVVDVSCARSVLPRARRFFAQRLARFAPHNTRKCMLLQKLRREIQ